LSTIIKKVIFKLLEIDYEKFIAVMEIENFVFYGASLLDI
jgi:hypothetical protein